MSDNTDRIMLDLAVALEFWKPPTMWEAFDSYWAAFDKKWREFDGCL